MFIEWHEPGNKESTSWDPVSGTSKQFEEFLKSHDITIQECNKDYYIWICR